MRMIRIFDTTLRDGEQSPGASMNIQEKLMVAKQLARLGVDVIEAGFAFSSPGDFEAIKTIGNEVERACHLQSRQGKGRGYQEGVGGVKGCAEEADPYVPFHFGHTPETSVPGQQGRGVEKICGNGKACPEPC